MRSFTVTWDPRGALDLLAARNFLGPVRAADLDAELDVVRERLSALPESGQKALIRGKWSETIRKVNLSCVPYRVYYRLDMEARRVVLFCVWHRSRRLPRL